MNRCHRFMILLLLAVAAAYANSMGGAFQFDDYNVIVNYAAVHSFADFLADLSHGIRPLLKLSYTVNWVTGFGPAGFHLVNISIHAINSILLFFIGRLILVRATPLGKDAVERVSFVAALVFSLHPVQTEAVTYICGRSTSLMAVFYLGSCLCYLRGDKRPLLRYLVSPALFLCAMAVKETAVTLPVALLLMESVRFEQPWLRTALRRQAIHWGILLLVLVLLVLHPRYGDLLLYSIETRTLAENVLTQVNALWYLASRLFMVRSLNIDPDLPVMTSWSFTLGLQAVAIVLLLAVSAAARRRMPMATFCTFWFFLHLVPTNSVVPRLDVANDRQLYLPLFGITLLAAFAWERLSGHAVWRRRMAAAAVTACALVLGISTYLRNADYRTEVTLWRDTARKSPGKPRVWNNLGYAYYQTGCYADARASYLKAIELNPRFRTARNNLADAEKLLKLELARQLLQGGPFLEAVPKCRE